MNFFTASRGIANNPQVSHLLKTNKVRLLSFLSPKFFAKSKPVLVGWGYKANTLKTRALAKKHQLPYWALEDGFISWLNHPSQSKPYQRLSYIIDKVGMYYDASNPSGLDLLLNNQGDFDSARIDRLREQLLKLKISKYNQVRCQQDSWPSWLLDLHNNKTKFLLLVDQTFGDASIEFSGGSAESFERMLAWAVERLEHDSQLNLVLKIHPDVLLGKKTGYLFDVFNVRQLDADLANRIHLLSDDIAPADLILMSCEVVTVSSQMGFEALWQNKPVTCFAWPFYAGRGLTHDKCEQPLTYLRKQVSLNQLLQGALIDSPVYLHPDTQKVCEAEDIMDYLQAHFLTRDMLCDALAIPSVSLWKRSFIPEFIAASAKKIKFSVPVKNETALLWGMKDQVSAVDVDSRLRGRDGGSSNFALLQVVKDQISVVEEDSGLRDRCVTSGSDVASGNNVVAVSNVASDDEVVSGHNESGTDNSPYPRGNVIPECCNRGRLPSSEDSVVKSSSVGKTIWRIEDGFIRSVGLGADLRRPSSLVLDDEGIYYNGKQSSRLETLLEYYQLNAYEQYRAKKLLSQLRESNITKYNVESSSDVERFVTQANGREVVLVTGQFQLDLSMQFGAEEIRDNLTLLQQVKQDFPTAYIIYKEHPDVYSGVRPGRIDEQAVHQYADAYVTDTSLTDLFSITQRLCTICSLAGFEALTRGISVTTYGLPFYAGWGLTDDKCDFPRRSCVRSIEELAYVALVLYARYVNWDNRQITTVESTINTLVCDRPQTMQLKTSWVARQSRKIGYLSQALLKPHRSFNSRFGSRS
ncbi:MAG: capsule polysaccharide export protein KpsC/LpsZ [Oceanicoccus sp.]|jgi:capsule polysaccharide export protein KpsC/LpsZ